MMRLLLFFALVAFARAQCEFQRDGYKLSWEVQGKDVHFDLTFRPSQNGDFWSGVAFGRSMGSLDFIQVAVVSGTPSLADMTTSGYGIPSLDTAQNVNLASATFSDGELKAKFSRKLSTGDIADKDITGCQYFQFPYSGGRMSGKNTGKHHRTPKAQQICNIQKCGANEIPATPPPPPPTRPATAPVATGNAAAPANNQNTYFIECSYRRDNYELQWFVENDKIFFDFKFRPSFSGDFWTGIGFGKDMYQMDFIAITFAAGRARITDAFTSGYRTPHPDPHNNVSAESVAMYSDGQLHVQFSRDLVTGDDLDADLSQCITFQFPYTGGQIRDRLIRKHESTPEAIRKCNIAWYCKR